MRIRSRILPESIRVGLFNMFCRPNLLMISRSLLCLLAVLLLVICCLLQSISGRLKSPAMTTMSYSDRSQGAQLSVGLSFLCGWLGCHLAVSL